MDARIKTARNATTDTMEATISLYESEATLTALNDAAKAIEARILSWGMIPAGPTCVCGWGHGVTVRRLYQQNTNA